MIILREKEKDGRGKGRFAAPGASEASSLLIYISLYHSIKRYQCQYIEKKVGLPSRSSLGCSDPTPGMETEFWLKVWGSDRSRGYFFPSRLNSNSNSNLKSKKADLKRPIQKSNSNLKCANDKTLASPYVNNKPISKYVTHFSISPYSGIYTRHIYSVYW